MLEALKMVNDADAEFERKIQRLRHTGVGGVQMSAGETGRSAQTRHGEETTVRMKVEKGVVVASPVFKKGQKPRVAHDGSIKVFSLRNMEIEKQPQIQTTNEPVSISQPDTEESIIGEIIKLQKKLSAFRDKN
jgi:hypothetical protein